MKKYYLEVYIAVFVNDNIESSHIKSYSGLTANYLETILKNREVTKDQIDNLFALIGSQDKNPLIWVKKDKYSQYVYKSNFEENDNT
jgi:hypothetical protein